MKGFAQASVQMESSLTGRKRKAEEIDDEQEVFGIVTDVENMVEEVLSRIVWLLKEAQKPVQSGVKRVKSLSNLAGKSN